MSISIPGFRHDGRSEAYLVYHVDEGLGVILMEFADHLTPILTRKDGLDQGGAIGKSEGAFDQTPDG